MRHTDMLDMSGLNFDKCTAHGGEARGTNSSSTSLEDSVRSRRSGPKSSKHMQCNVFLDADNTFYLAHRGGGA
jgi:hypothetical protein